MSSFDPDQGELLLTSYELEALGAAASGGDVPAEIVSSLQGIGVLDAAGRPAPDLRPLATTIAKAETRYTHTCVEAGSTSGYQIWVTDDALVGHPNLPADMTDGPAAGSVLFASSDRLPVVLRFS